MPTNFGRAGYRIDSKVDQGMIEAVIDPPHGEAAENRSCFDCAIRRRNRSRPSTVGGRPHQDFDPAAETITVTPDSERMTRQGAVLNMSAVG